jgi:hypothetical protein
MTYLVKISIAHWDDNGLDNIIHVGIRSMGAIVVKVEARKNWRNTI